MNIIRQISVVLVVCALSVCLFAGCGPAEPLAGDETTTATDTVTTTLGDTGASDSPSSFDTTDSQTVTPSNSAQPSQEATTTPSAITTTTTAPKTPGATADVSGIFIGGKALSDFKVGTKNYTYYLDAGTTTAPQVTASQTAGTGEITITQAANANGTAKVTLNGTTYTIQFVVRRSEMDRLNNTYYQLKVAKKLNVAYLGGSVTDGYGSTSKATKSWRALTTQWLKSQYPNATITETNAGIGGTGSFYGAHRVIQDLKLTSATEKPDLVFIEFASNDDGETYINTTPDVYMESIIQTIYKYAPQADIVMVYITNFRRKDTEFPSKVAHKKVAEAYQIPYVDVGAPLWKEIVKENGGVAPTSFKTDAAWLKYYKDSVHPIDAGYAKYAQYVQEFLSDILSKKTTTPSGRVNSYVPSKTLNTLPVAPYIDNLKGFTPSDSKIKVNSSTGYITSTSAWASFTFKFTGTDLNFWIYGQSTSEADTGVLNVSIDGGAAKKIAITGNNHKILPVASGLANKEHTVTVELAPVANNKVNLNLRYFLISGDTSMRGITLVK